MHTSNQPCEAVQTPKACWPAVPSVSSRINETDRVAVEDLWYWPLPPHKVCEYKNDIAETVINVTQNRTISSLSTFHAFSLENLRWYQFYDESIKPNWMLSPSSYPSLHARPVSLSHEHFPYLDLAGAEMTASTVAGSRAIAAKAVLLDPTSFKFLFTTN